MKQASHSKWPTASPLAAPVPARPTRCSLPMFEANRLAPTANHPTFPAREEKVGADVLLPARPPSTPIPASNEEIGGDDGDVECVEVAHGLVGSRRY